MVRLPARATAPLLARLEGIEAATARMTRLIDTVSDLARTPLGAALELDRAPCDLGAPVAGHEARYAGQSPHRLALRAEVPTLTLPLDAARIGRVVDNRLSTAVTFSPGASGHPGADRGGRAAHRPERRHGGGRG